MLVNISCFSVSIRKNVLNLKIFHQNYGFKNFGMQILFFLNKVAILDVTCNDLSGSIIQAAKQLLVLVL